MSIKNNILQSENYILYILADEKLHHANKNYILAGENYIKTTSMPKLKRRHKYIETVLISTLKILHSIQQIIKIMYVANISTFALKLHAYTQVSKNAASEIFMHQTVLI